jgi:DnaK suppressor protein
MVTGANEEAKETAAITARDVYRQAQQHAAAQSNYNMEETLTRFESWIKSESQTQQELVPDLPVLGPVHAGMAVARKRLEEMREDLERTISVLVGEHHRIRSGSAAPGGAAANLTEADRNSAAVQLALAQRAEVLAALARIDEDNYGRCVDCGNPVPESRLEARPATARCVPCQAKRDRRRLPSDRIV